MTLRNIRLSLLQALRTLLVAHGGAFHSVQSFAGQIRSPASVDLVGLGRTPALVVGFERERYDRSNDSETLLSRASLSRAESWWQVFVITTDLRTHDEVVGDPSPNGIDACVQSVLEALTRLDVELVETLPLVNRPGEFIHVIRLRVERVLRREAEPTSEGVPLERVDGTLDEGQFRLETRSNTKDF